MVVADACVRAVARDDIEAVLWMSWLLGLGGLLIVLLAFIGIPLATALGQRKGKG